MQDKTNRLVYLMMSLILLLTFHVWPSVVVVAEETVVQPRYSYTSYTSTSFTEGSGGVLTCYAKAQGYSGITTRIHIKMELQKFGTIKWETVTTWESTVFTYHSSMNKTKAVSVSGLYRVKATYTVYSGGAYEIITSYSGEEFITV